MPKGIYMRDAASRNTAQIDEILRKAGDNGCSIADIADVLGLSEKYIKEFLANKSICWTARAFNTRQTKYFHVQHKEAGVRYIEALRDGRWSAANRFSRATMERIVELCRGGKTRQQAMDASGIGHCTVHAAIALATSLGILVRVHPNGSQKPAVWYHAEDTIPEPEKPKAKAKKPKAKALKVVVLPKSEKKPSTADKFRQAAPIIPAGVKVTRGRDFVPNARYSVERPEPVFSRLRYGEYL